MEMMRKEEVTLNFAAVSQSFVFDMNLVGMNLSERYCMAEPMGRLENGMNLPNTTQHYVKFESMRNLNYLVDIEDDTMLVGCTHLVEEEQGKVVAVAVVEE